MSKTPLGPVITVVSVTELGDPQPGLRDAIQLAKTVNKRAGLLSLARLNIDQSLANLRREWVTRRDIQSQILRQVLSRKRLDQLQQRLGMADVTAVQDNGR